MEYISSQETKAQPRTRLTSVEQTPVARNESIGKATFDRYTYIKKADYNGSQKQIALKKSDKTKSDLIHFMHEINRLGGGSTDIAEAATKANSISKQNKTSIYPRDNDIDDMLGYD